MTQYLGCNHAVDRSIQVTAAIRSPSPSKPAATARG